MTKYLVFSIILCVVGFLSWKRCDISDIIPPPIASTVNSIFYTIPDNSNAEYIEKLLGDLSKLNSQNLELKRKIIELSNTPDYPEYKNITARISLQPVFSFPEFLFIDKGKDEGVEKFSIVLSSGYVVGRISEVNKKSSKVVTVFSPTFYIDVIFERTGERAILAGRGDGNMELIRTLSGVDVYKNEDTALTSGVNFYDPFGIPVGKRSGKNVKVFIQTSKLLYVSVLSPALPK